MTAMVRSHHYLRRVAPMLALVAACGCAANVPDRPVATSSTAQELATASARVVADIRRTGDGRTPETAMTIPYILWAFPVLRESQLVFVSQRSEMRGSEQFDAITVSEAGGASQRTVWFRTVPGSIASEQALPESQRSNPETDRTVRRILTSGDGRTPDTAFATGGALGAQYQVLRFMGLQHLGRGLVNIRGCSFDVHTARGAVGGPVRQVYFLLGGTGFDYSGRCRLEAPGRPDQLQSGQGMLPR